MKDPLDAYAGLKNIHGNRAFTAWQATLPEQIAQILDPNRPGQHGQLPDWLHDLNNLPYLPASQRNLNAAAIEVSDDADTVIPESLTAQLQRFAPWRKGPYSLHGVYIDSEWRSDWKWQRVKDHISPLTDRLVLDVGCGNGYHCWRMAGVGAHAVLGLDPMLLYVMQFLAVQHFLQTPNVLVLPLRLEDIPRQLHAFDTVFSMGVLYHRRSPLDHLFQLRECLRPGGELILETLVIEGKPGESLMPQDRYARMRNVWFIPSCATLQRWLQRCGFNDIRVVDVSATTTEEQRVTHWSGDESLRDFLDPEDSSRTIEGYPAPQRAIVVARI